MGHMQQKVHIKQKCKHIYVYVVVGGMVGMHANDLLMNSSTVSRQTEPNSDLHLKVIFALTEIFAEKSDAHLKVILALTKPIVANPPGSV